MLIKDRVKVLIKESLNDLYEDSNNELEYIYHCARDSQTERSGYKSIFKFGFERYYIASGVGNMYGPGVYATTDLNSSVVNAHRGEYGKVIIKARIKSYDKFLIWNKDIAKRVYGNNWPIEKQLRLLLPPELFDKLAKINTNLTDGGLINYLAKDRVHTSKAAVAFWGAFRDTRGSSNPYNYIHGFVFRGERDGLVAVIKDVKNAVPTYFSKDYGKTWENGMTEDTLKYAENSFDSEYHFGEKYNKTYPAEYGYAKVEKNGRVNYIDKNGKEISPVWFEGGSNFIEVIEGVIPMAEILYNDTPLYLASNGQVFDSLEDGYPLCTIEDIDEYV